MAVKRKKPPGPAYRIHLRRGLGSLPEARQALCGDGRGLLTSQRSTATCPRCRKKARAQKWRRFVKAQRPKTPKPDPYGRPWRALPCYDPDARYVTNAQDEALFVADTKLARLIVKAVNTYKGSL
jgi:hypothetical protein